MRAVVIEKPEVITLRDVAVPEVGPYQALVKIDVAALCNATDGKLIAGHFPGVDTYPMVLGHEGTGIVCEVGAKVRSFAVGDRAIGGMVFSFKEGLASGWGGFCDYVLVNDHDAMVADGVADEAHGWFECYEIQRKVDADIPAAEAALLCTWREVYGGIGDFNIQPKDKVLVYGAGPVGLSFVLFCKLMGVKWVGLVDPLAHKRERALRMGADAVFTPDALDVAPGSLDVVVDAVGSGAIVNAALPLIKLGGTIGVYGVIAAPTLTVEKAKGPYNFNLIVHQWPTRWREREAQAPLCAWIREGKLKAADFVTHTFPVEDITAAVAAVRSGEVVKCLLSF
ncbi:MAG: zinc-binding dehydrogenase [Kiritimatiellaeota bacterium]|nr:zinc-binding dehydrogenase [Kiritimatiellota bacterium]